MPTRSSIDVSGSAEAEIVPPSVAESKPRLRLRFLDGLRGVASVYVLLFHVKLFATFSETPAWLTALGSLIRLGHFAVCVFIVLSGYCLMLPLVRSTERRLGGGWRGFLYRRARRILPPYYVALVFSVLWILIYEGSKYRSGHANTLAVTLTPGDLISHLLLVHNVVRAWWGEINGTFWSVATEWQIYFLFAFLLVPVWRAFGNLAALLAAALAGLGPHYLLPEGAWREGADRACSWFVLLFAFGMGAASLRIGSARASRLPWGRLGLALTLLLAWTVWITQRGDDPWRPDLIRHFTWLTDALAGAVTVCLLMHCTATLHYETPGTAATTAAPGRGPLLRLLESPLAVALGEFSYSLYLIHLPLVALCYYLAVHLPLAERLRAPVFWLATPLISLAVAWGFSRVFERPFMSPAGPSLR